MTRRRLVHGVCCAAASLVCGGAAQAAPSLAAGPSVPRDAGYLVQPIRGGLYWVTDGAYSTMFLVTAAGVVACDAPPTLGAKYLRAIADVTNAPVTHLVYSHEHVDHIGASGVFPRDVTIVAHATTAANLARRGDATRREPTVTFEERYALKVGGQTLELAYRGPNHSADNIFIYAPAQRTLMLIDVVYPGWMPYKNLGVAVDVPGFVEAHRQALAYDFDTLVAGHVSRPGTRADVQLQLELLRDLEDAAARAYAGLSFGAYLGAHPPLPGGPSAWDLHEAYENALVDGMVAELLPRWRTRLAGTETYLRDNCWAMLETFVVQGRPHVGDALGGRVA